MGYKMVFCDIDGTLIDSTHRIAAGTKGKIQELDRSGVPFVLVSARMPSGIIPIQQELGISAPMVCYSGALILDGEGNAVNATGIGRDRAMDIEAYIKDTWKTVCCSAFCDRVWLVDDARNKWVAQEQQITTSIPTEGGIADLVDPGNPVHKFLIMGDAGDIAGLGDALKEKYSGLTIYRSKDTYLEVMDGAVSKSAAVRYLCKAYGVPIESTVSFGDNYNDVDMLLATGAGFAMGNAPEEVKRQVGSVTADNDHEGVLAGLMGLDFS